MSAQFADNPAPEQKCQFQTPDEFCTKSGTAHIWYKEGAVERLTINCDKHLQWWINRDDIKFDYHEVGHVCGLSGATWVFSYTRRGDGTCVIDWGESQKALWNTQARQLVDA